MSIALPDRNQLLAEPVALPRAERKRSHGWTGTLWEAWPALLLVGIIGAPIAALLVLALGPDEGLWAHLAGTVLGEYVVTTAVLAVGTGVTTALVGAGCAWLVTMYRFPGRRFFNWAMVLPLAMPAYVLAYAYTDLLQVTGPVQTALRAITGWPVRGYWFPEIRSTGGAIFVLSAVLYPYVFVLARTAFLEQSQCALEVSRTLGCTPLAAFRRVGLPLARPAVMAGVAFVVMETLADFGAVAYFEQRTFTTGIYRAWYALGSPVVAAQLASVLLMAVLAVVALERLSRGQARFSTNTTHIFRKNRQRLSGPLSALACLACVLPLTLGFVLPAIVLAAMALDRGSGIGLARLAELTSNTVLLAGLASVVIVATAALATWATVQQRDNLLTARLVRLATLGYAVPGAVIGVGVLIALGAFDAALAELGAAPALMIGGSIAAVLYGYLVRFFAIAYNPLEAGLAKVTAQLTDAARVLGCTTARTLRRVHLPLLRPSLLGALLLVFIDVMKELPATMILRPFDLDTLAVEAFQLATTERLYAAALPSLVIVVAGLVPVLVLCRLLDRGRTAARAKR